MHRHLLGSCELSSLSWTALGIVTMTLLRRCHSNRWLQTPMSLSHTFVQCYAAIHCQGRIRSDQTIFHPVLITMTLGPAPMPLWQRGCLGPDRDSSTTCHYRSKDEAIWGQSEHSATCSPIVMYHPRGSGPRTKPDHGEYGKRLPPLASPLFEVGKRDTVHTAIRRGLRWLPILENRRISDLVHLHS